jgi:hypothetical protein
VIEALLVTMNNYFHDLAVAFLWASSLLAWVVLRHWPGEPSVRVVTLLRRIAWGSFAWVLVGGAVRAWFFREYEWLPKAGTAQVPALAVKHLLLFALTAWGLAGVVRLGRRTAAAAKRHEVTGR